MHEWTYLDRFRAARVRHVLEVLFVEGRGDKEVPVRLVHYFIDVDTAELLVRKDDYDDEERTDA